MPRLQAATSAANCAHRGWGEGRELNYHYIIVKSLWHTKPAFVENPEALGETTGEKGKDPCLPNSQSPRHQDSGGGVEKAPSHNVLFSELIISNGV